jgi:hypothetical protein
MTTNVPVGLATKLGLLGTALLSLAAILTPLLPDTGANTSKVMAACATALAGMVVIGRSLQAAAQMLATARVTQLRDVP